MLEMWATGHIWESTPPFCGFVLVIYFSSFLLVLVQKVAMFTVEEGTFLLELNLGRNINNVNMSQTSTHWLVVILTRQTCVRRLVTLPLIV